MKNYTEDEVNEWLEKIEDVNKKVSSNYGKYSLQVRDIMDGKVDCEQLEEEEIQKEKMDRAKEEIKKREA